MKKRKESELLQAVKERRNQIDLIDQKLLSLLNQRLSIALEIGAMKRERGKDLRSSTGRANFAKIAFEKSWSAPLRGSHEDIQKDHDRLPEISDSC